MDAAQRMQPGSPSPMRSVGRYAAWRRDPGGCGTRRAEPRRARGRASDARWPPLQPTARERFSWPLVLRSVLEP